MENFKEIDLDALNNFLTKKRGITLIQITELKKLLNNNKKILPIVEFTKQEKEVFDYVWSKKIIMGQPEGLINTILSVKYVIEQNIDGDFVECGVWQGGHALAAAMLFKLYNNDKMVHLFDTFEGMTEPSQFDVKTLTGEHAGKKFNELKRENYNEWCYANIELVESHFIQSGVNLEKVKMIKGDVSKTLKIKSNIPQDISILRLDTDFYQSTKDELKILYPILRSSGVLILDDYGSWSGVQKATDEYFETSEFIRPFFQIATLSAGVRCGIKI